MNNEDLLKMLLQSKELITWHPDEYKYYGETTRHLQFFGQVNNQSASTLISQLHHLNDLENESLITIHLNTEGGDLTDALAIYDCIVNLQAPVCIIATGLCASAGLLILSAGDYRMASQNTVFYYHQPVMSEGTINSIQAMESVKDYYSFCQSTTDTIIRKRASISSKTWKRNFDQKTSYYFASSKALEYDLIDEILDSKKLNYDFITDLEDDDDGE